MADCIPHRIFCDHLSRYPHCHQTHSVTGNPVESALVHYGDEFLKHDNLHGGNLLILKTLLKIEHVFNAVSNNSKRGRMSSGNSDGCHRALTLIPYIQPD